MRNYTIIILLFWITSCGSNDKKVEQEHISDPSSLLYEVIMTLEHDPSAYTQGLVFYNDKIIESTIRLQGGVVKKD